MNAQTLVKEVGVPVAKSKGGGKKKSGLSWKNTIGKMPKPSKTKGKTKK
jgi:hypothetical protein